MQLVFDDMLVEALHKAVTTTMSDVFTISTESDSCSLGDRMPLVLEAFKACSITIKQEDILCGAFIAAFSREILVKILQQYKVGDTSDPALLGDAAAEIANMIYGAFKTDMNKRGYHLTMDIPVVLNNNRDVLDRYGEADKMVLPFKADGHQCKIIIAQRS